VTRDLINPTTIALALLLVVLLVASTSRLWVAIATSIVAMLAFNFFALPPVGTLSIADPQNWVALFAFLVVSVVASNLSSMARTRATAILVEQSRVLDERKAAELARQSEELKSALLASIAHDLRTPLTAIRIAASNLQAEWLTEADRREQSDVVRVEIARLGRLFENILEMARIDAGAIAASERWAPLSDIVDAARDQVAQTLAHHTIAVEIGRDGLVRLDPRLAAAALAHLLENAAQHAPDGSTISVIAEAAADGLVISVRDRGPGIAPADLPRLFERFYRGGESRRGAAGTGMGLSIARGLLAVERGRIWAENCVDGGARFTMAVPAERKDLAVQS
jgi:two-component system sensor histidine kinase KdpD